MVNFTNQQGSGNDRPWAGLPGVPTFPDGTLCASANVLRQTNKRPVVFAHRAACEMVVGAICHAYVLPVFEPVGFVQAEGDPYHHADLYSRRWSGRNRRRRRA